MINEHNVSWLQEARDEDLNSYSLGIISSGHDFFSVSGLVSIFRPLLMRFLAASE